MSDTTPAPLCKARCSAACSTCARYTRILLVLTCATLLCALLSAVIGICAAVDTPDDSGSAPAPTPSSTAPATPSPSETATQPPSTAEPTGSPCNIFDPECSPNGVSGGGSVTDEPTPTGPDGGANGGGGAVRGTTGG